MKLKVKHFDQSVFEEKLSHLSKVDFSLFVDDIPSHYSELSSINILVLQEPNEYFGLHDWAIQNKDNFTLILTWDDKVLNNCDNAMFLPFGHTWFKKDQYEETKLKQFEIAHLRGNLNKTYGHGLRHELLSRKNEIIVPTKFYDVYGDRHNIEDARKGKEQVFGFSQYGVAIENTQHRGYFTEKILDCFLLKTIPIYWGCSNINEFFDSEGIITFTSVDDLIYKVNQLDENYYESKREAINKNWNTALNFVDYEQNIADTITKVFKLNDLI